MWTGHVLEQLESLLGDWAQSLSQAAGGGGGGFHAHTPLPQTPGLDVFAALSPLVGAQHVDKVVWISHNHACLFLPPQTPGLDVSAALSALVGAQQTG